MHHGGKARKVGVCDVAKLRCRMERPPCGTDTPEPAPTTRRPPYSSPPSRKPVAPTSSRTRDTPVSYTHLDVYKRQGIHRRDDEIGRAHV